MEIVNSWMNGDFDNAVRQTRFNRSIAASVTFSRFVDFARLRQEAGNHKFGQKVIYIFESMVLEVSGSN